MRKLADETPLAGLKSSIFLFRQPVVLYPAVVGALVTAALFLKGMAATGHLGAGDFVTLLFLAPLMGFGFAVLTGLPGFLIYRGFGPKLTFAPDADETVLKEEVANHFLRDEGRGGKLVLTSRRVVFVPHRFNFQLDRVELRLGDIDAVEWARVVGPSGAAMSTFLELATDGRRERYVVRDAEALGKLVEETAEAADLVKG